MPNTTCHMSISLDGFVAGPDQSREHPLGKRGRELHALAPRRRARQRGRRDRAGWLMRPRGAYVMGRNMFGPIRGEWEEDWRGWWGPEPPYHAPVFVLTHHAHKPIEMEGGTTFHFVTDGFDAAYAQARETAGDDGVDIAGGASTVRQALMPGSSTSSRSTSPQSCSGPASGFRRRRIFGLEPVEVLHSPLATQSATAERAEGQLLRRLPATAPSLPMRTARDPLRASCSAHRPASEPPGTFTSTVWACLLEPVVDCFLHAARRLFSVTHGCVLLRRNSQAPPSWPGQEVEPHPGRPDSEESNGDEFRGGSGLHPLSRSTRARRTS